MDVWTRLTLQLGILPVNAATNKSNLTTDTFKKALELAKQIYSIPGNPPKFSRDPFLKDKTTAMFGSVTILDVLPSSGLNWDVAQYPSYKDKPNIFTQYDLHVMAVSSTSKYKDDALKAMQVFLSDEVSKISTSQTGRVPLLVDPKFKEYFGSENPGLKGKKLSSIFKSKPNPNSAVFTKWHSKSYEIANKHVTQYLNNQIDLNTATRNADEEINKWIQDNP
jgi:multiple sugar transport system substrate-binding protein